ncbi:MAG: metal-dependent transcriptional regulator [Deltaproteobacteria bacterium]|nr:metal-dependent transcriptional regulator [Deltaproteobacteria bacterium]
MKEQSRRVNHPCGQIVARPHEMDELLERVWTQREKGKEDQTSLLAATPVEEGERWLKGLLAEKLIHLEGGSPEGEKVLFTPEGEKEAREIIRRHRLTERLFADVLKTSEEVWEREACELEHQTVLTEEAVSAVCSFLGHPPTCPHGRPIPRGRCCSEFKKDLTPFVIPLSEAQVTESYKIVFMTPENHRRLDRLAVLGILPGSTIRIHQKRPSYVIRCGETDVALDLEIVKDIYVRKG